MNTLIAHPEISAKVGKLDLYALTFDLPFRLKDISKFRGAFVEMVGWENDLFHNHNNQEGNSSGYMHRYPLIQYRVHGGHAAILGINEGANTLEDLHRSGAFDRFCLQGRSFPLQVLHRNRDRGVEMQVTEALHRYRIYCYQPFVGESYRKYKSTPDLTGKVSILETLLRNHIVSFAYGVGVDLPETPRIKVTLNDIDRVKKVKMKDSSRMGFDMVFSVNAILPEGVGIGKNTSHGYGFILPLERFG